MEKSELEMIEDSISGISSLKDVLGTVTTIDGLEQQDTIVGKYISKLIYGTELEDFMSGELERIGERVRQSADPDDIRNLIHSKLELVEEFLKIKQGGLNGSFDERERVLREGIELTLSAVRNAPKSMRFSVPNMEMWERSLANFRKNIAAMQFDEVESFVRGINQNLFSHKDYKFTGHERLISERLDDLEKSSDNANFGVLARISSGSEIISSKLKEFRSSLKDSRDAFHLRDFRSAVDHGANAETLRDELKGMFISEITRLRERHN